MMSLKKLMLASAIAAVSTSSFAMEAMDDSSMSATTGQDGLTLTLATQLSMNMYIHDNDGFTGATDSGAIGIKGIGISNGAGGNVGLSIVVDAGANVATAPVLQVGVSTTTNTSLALGTLTVANSNRSAASLIGADWGVTSESGTLMNLGTLSFGATTDLLKIQMGSELAAQGAWMRLATTLNGGLTITGFSLNDAGGAITGGGIAGDLQVVNTAGGTNLTADLKVDANTTGLVLGLTTLGVAGTGAGTGMDVRLANLKLGDTLGATTVGDIEIIGLNLNGTTITVAGH